MARKFKNVFFENLTYTSMYKAYLFCKKNKRYRPDIIKFSFHLEWYINSIVKSLSTNTFSFKEYNSFYVYEPKKRKVLAAPFCDRIVHTWYVKSFLEPIFTPTFISTSYACIKGRGLHKCILDISKCMKYCLSSEKFKKGYILKMDIFKFFYSIDRNILLNILKKKVPDKNFATFSKKLLDTSKNISYSQSDLDLGIPIGKNIGIPIGNYTSQFFGNIYLNELDQYLKHELKVKFVFRYMDDTLCFFENKELAKEALEKITDFLDEKLKLKLNAKTSYFKISQGVNFCGFRIKGDKILLNTNSKKRFKFKMKNLIEGINVGDISVDAAKKKYAGYFGFISKSNYKGLLSRYVDNIF